MAPGEMDCEGAKVGKEVRVVYRLLLRLALGRQIV